mmetsp:Transcript_12654/g.29380  ORF Transcript_12654/g.29380 Transcript_12654/m.29380 type:complete len:93 (-) Transcript_12654:583-861(-)
MACEVQTGLPTADTNFSRGPCDRSSAFLIVRSPMCWCCSRWSDPEARVRDSSSREENPVGRQNSVAPVTSDKFWDCGVSVVVFDHHESTADS